MHTLIHTCSDIHTSSYAHARTHTFTHHLMHIHAHIHSHVHRQIHAHTTYIHALMHIQTHTSTRAWTHTRTSAASTNASIALVHSSGRPPSSCIKASFFPSEANGRPLSSATVREQRDWKWIDFGKISKGTLYSKVLQHFLLDTSALFTHSL